MKTTNTAHICYENVCPACWKITSCKCKDVRKMPTEDFCEECGPLTKRNYKGVSYYGL